MTSDKGYIKKVEKIYNYLLIAGFMRILSWILFVGVVILEGVFTTLPLTLLFLLCLTVMKRQEWIFPLAFISGLFLDFFSFRTPGVTSLFFVCYIFLLLLYQRKYETATMPFVVIAAFFGSTLYSLLIGEVSFLLQGIISTLIAAVAFSWYRMHKKPDKGDGFLHV